MARFGAAIGQGFIEAGGRNVTISLQSRAGGRNTSAIVGMVLFCQFWYWYPLAHCASLAFQPTGIIGIDGNLDVSWNCSPSSTQNTERYISRHLNSNLCRMHGQVSSLTPHPQSLPRRKLSPRSPPLFFRLLPNRRPGKRKRPLRAATLWTL